MGFVIETEPIIPSLSVRTHGLLLKRARRSRSWASSATPFASPKTSHTRHTGSRAKPANKPNPPMAWRGDLSLKKNGSPGTIAEKFVPPGRQKFTSSTAWRDRKYWYQP